MKAKRKKAIRPKAKKEYPFQVTTPPKRHCHPWSKDEEKWVLDYWSNSQDKCGHTIREVAAICDRTERSIELFLKHGRKL